MFFATKADRCEHTYHFVKIVNNEEEGKSMFVLKDIRVAAATLIRVLFKRFKLNFVREKILLPSYKKEAFI